MEEEWRYVKHDGKEVFSYQVSSIGRIKSLLTARATILKTRVNQWGYEVVNLKIEKETKTKQIHRLVAEAFLGSDLTKSQVNHKDGDKLNNRLDNLEWVTPKENMEHANMMQLRMSRSHKQLSDREKDAILYLTTLSEISYLTIATAFSVNKRTISRVASEWRKEKASDTPASKV
ncbi:HNH endonuclease signature motif containing protein [uncultured Enterococcus sp.]|uniref:HNH endonuclease signature motif containing protein n=1 Tax=uncultured Enterococcus sp. TaxID=167972 RepID=UPI002AA7BFB1|nr:HNH endonuclease signature motif containing protein [uncultured Enterococcus sp.]